MYKKPEPQSALSLGCSNTPPKLDEVTLAWASAMPSCSTEKSLTRNFAPRNYPHNPEQIAEEIRVDEKGQLWWKKQIKGKGRLRIMDKPISANNGNGYERLKLNGYCYYNSTIVWCLYYGEWPKYNMIVDHINHNKRDNRKENLREVTHAENARNRKGAMSHSKSKVNGVYWCDTWNRWKASLMLNGKHINGGTYTLFEDAVEARQKLEEQYKTFGYSQLCKNLVIPDKVEGLKL